MNKENKVEPQKLNPVNEAKPVDEAEPGEVELDEAELDKINGGSSTSDALKALGDGLQALARKQ